jgi:mannose/fructose/N-acetylgalactosamine-specific phosphotransferase system component IIB
MPIALFRVDERLIHGQVTVGWGGRLHPTRYVVVDDALRRSEWEQEIHRLGTPPEASSEFFSVEEARSRLDRWEGSGEVIILLTRTVDAMLDLARGGRLRGRRVNLGGIHHAPGRRKVLSYLFLDPEDEARISALQAEGVEVMAKDLPGSPGAGADRLLR